MHNDIKPSNFLVKDDKIYLSDFGFACALTKELAQKINVEVCLYSGGTKRFISPQVLKVKSQGLKKRIVIDFKKIDIYALGVSFYYLLYFDYPTDNNGNLDITLIDEDPYINTYLRNMIKSMLNNDPFLRPSAYIVLNTIKTHVLGIQQKIS